MYCVTPLGYLTINFTMITKELLPSGSSISISSKAVDVIAIVVSSVTIKFIATVVVVVSNILSSMVVILHVLAHQP